MVLIQCTFQDDKFLRDNERINCVRNYSWDVILRVTKTSDHWSMAICCEVSRSRIWYYTEPKLKMMYISALALLKKQIIPKWLNRYPTCILSFNQITEFDILVNITLTSLWARWRLGSPASRLFTQAFIQAHITENIKAPFLFNKSATWKNPAQFNNPSSMIEIMFIPHDNGTYVSSTYMQNL